MSSRSPVTPPIVAPDGSPLPESGGRSDAFVIERASATPLAPFSPLPVKARADVSALREQAVEPLRPPLAQTQAWFTAIVTHPKSATDGIRESAAILAVARSAEVDVAVEVEVERIVTPGPQLSATERLGIYQFAYHARLIECLADDYPVLKHALGEAKFEALARRYIERHPSTHPNLNGFGRRFAGFCAEEGDWLELADFAADLARLEWAIVEVIHAPPSPPLPLDMLQALAPVDWPRIKLLPSTTLRFLELSFPVNRFFQAVKVGEAAVIPEREWSATAIYRDGFTVWRMDFTRAMAGVLNALIAGRTLGEALDTIEQREAEGGMEEDVMAWFRAWVAGGFFGALGE